MKTLEIFHNKCAKQVCNMKPNDSNSKALDLLHWKTLDARRKFHRCAIIYKSRGNDIWYSVNDLTGKDLQGIHHNGMKNFFIDFLWRSSIPELTEFHTDLPVMMEDEPPPRPLSKGFSQTTKKI